MDTEERFLLQGFRQAKELMKKKVFATVRTCENLDSACWPKPADSPKVSPSIQLLRYSRKAAEVHPDPGLRLEQQ